MSAYIACYLPIFVVLLLSFFHFFFVLYFHIIICKQHPDPTICMHFFLLYMDNVASFIIIINMDFKQCLFIHFIWCLLVVMMKKSKILYMKIYSKKKICISKRQTKAFRHSQPQCRRVG